MNTRITRTFGAIAAVAALGLGGGTAGVTASPASVAHGSTAYVANQFSGTVTPIRTATNTALKPITVGSGPVAIAITP